MSDLISRQAAIDAVVTWTVEDRPDIEMPTDLVARINALPSAQPERKTGKWIYNSPVTMKCNQCGLVIKDWDWHRFKYCPNCCSDMRGGRE